MENPNNTITLYSKLIWTLNKNLFGFTIQNLLHPIQHEPSALFMDLVNIREDFIRLLIILQKRILKFFLLICVDSDIQELLGAVQLWKDWRMTSFYSLDKPDKICLFTFMPIVWEDWLHVNYYSKDLQ